MSYECKRQGNVLVLESVHADWEAHFTGEKMGTSCPENSAWKMWGMDEFQLVRVEVEHTNALLPRLTECGYTWWNGESTWHGGQVRLYILKIACLPNAKTVVISMDMDHSKSLNEQRIAFVETLWQFEAAILRTRSLIRLVKAIRAKPSNRSRIDRYVAQLFGLIGSHI
ncbi:MAG: hypothetical protein ABSF55_01995 [Candidatus Staskawiczbacteria bacterium]|jgi:hypothetical protein